MSQDNNTVSMAQLVDWIRRFRDDVVLHKAELTDLDRAIGDADHGSNMARGTEAAVAKLETAPPGSPAELGKAVGMTLVSTVGGASGPLFGTFFLRFGTAAGTGDAIGTADLVAAWRAGVDGVLSRGKAQAGDKTMLDALIPAVEELAGAVEAGTELPQALEAMAQAAASGRDATVPMIAHKGRASYLGDRSAGHMDPGAASATMLVRALAQAVAA